VIQWHYSTLCTVVYQSLILYVFLTYQAIKSTQCHQLCCPSPPPGFLFKSVRERQEFHPPCLENCPLETSVTFLLGPFFFNSCTHTSRSAVGFPSHFLMSSPWSRRKNHKLSHGMFYFSRANPAKGHFLTRAAVYRKSSLSSVFCNLISFFSAGLASPLLRCTPVGGKRHRLLTAAIC